ncbi:hypothetical protein [Aquimarina spongiae]|uniref:Uncharacterized protein n=1 Tax=Aquimarina spongiae TaxID=570521 RepID=A0A1M6D6Z2_9FLAO|nr:hypothetical protein [Aquimarina spongiae]SHI68959.1 hypothetical protein SAMN04488508_102466 [Aquimarina spongiae]
MKKKKLDGLSLKKNVISRIGRNSIKGGGNDSNQSICDCGSGGTVVNRTKPCFSQGEDCDLIRETKKCESVVIHCL